MRGERERIWTKRGDRSERDVRKESSDLPEIAAYAARSLALDGLGNGAILALMRSNQLQRSARVVQPDDPLEDEADRVADQVMRMPTPEGSITASPPQVSRKYAAGEGENLPMLLTNPVGPPKAAASSAPLDIQRSSRQSNGQAEAAPASVGQVLAGAGKSLEPQLRQDMEQRFGQDFSRVRVHSSAAAEQSAERGKRQGLHRGPEHRVWCRSVQSPKSRGPPLARARARARGATIQFSARLEPHAPTTAGRKGSRASRCPTKHRPDLRRFCCRPRIRRVDPFNTGNCGTSHNCGRRPGNYNRWFDAANCWLVPRTLARRETGSA